MMCTQRKKPASWVLKARSTALGGGLWFKLYLRACSAQYCAAFVLGGSIVALLMSDYYGNKTVYYPKRLECPQWYQCAAAQQLHAQTLLLAVQVLAVPTLVRQL